MSEQAKVAYLQEGIKEAKRSERRGTVISIFGLILIIFSFLFALIIKITPPATYPLFLFLFLFGVVVGIEIIVWGMAISIHYAIQGGVLMEQLRRMAQKGLGL